MWLRKEDRKEDILDDRKGQQHLREEGRTWSQPHLVLAKHSAPWVHCESLKLGDLSGRCKGYKEKTLSQDRYLSEHVVSGSNGAGIRLLITRLKIQVWRGGKTGGINAPSP